MRSLLSRIVLALTLALALPLAALAAPSIYVDPNLDFGSVPIGGFNDAGPLITNNGPDTLKVTSMTLSGPDAANWVLLQPTSFPFAIRPFHYGFTTFRFSGSTPGAKSATLTITSNDPVNPTVIVAFTGTIFDPAPHIASVRDVPNDQGGQVKLSWDPSPYDRASPPPVADHYWVFRSVPPLVANARASKGARIATLFEGVTPREGALLSLATPSLSTIYWEFVAQVQATHFLPGYSLVVATTSDSTPASNPRTYFMVVALTADNAQYWQSAPDSGYSVDNLAPATPAPFTGSYSAGVTHLHWGRCFESDLDGYRVYRGATAGFVPGPGNLIGAQADTGLAVAGPAGSYYKLSAIDIHGNESAYALLGPGGTVDVPDATPNILRLLPPRPNPARGVTEFALWLPEAGQVSFVLHDTQGRQVRELVRGRQPAGEQRVIWDGRDDGGRSVPGGLYFATLKAAGRTLEARLVWLR